MFHLPAVADIQREIGLIGTRNAIEAAKRAIMAKVDTVVSVTRIYILQILIFQ